MTTPLVEVSFAAKVKLEATAVYTDIIRHKGGRWILLDLMNAKEDC